VSARILHQAFGLARQNDIAGQAEEEIRVAIGHDEFHQFRVGEVAIAPEEKQVEYR